MAGVENPSVFNAACLATTNRTFTRTCATTPMIAFIPFVEKHLETAERARLGIVTVSSCLLVCLLLSTSLMENCELIWGFLLKYFFRKGAGFALHNTMLFQYIYLFFFLFCFLFGFGVCWLYFVTFGFFDICSASL